MWSLWTARSSSLCLSRRSDPCSPTRQHRHGGAGSNALLFLQRRDSSDTKDRDVQEIRERFERTGTGRASPGRAQMAATKKLSDSHGHPGSDHRLSGTPWLRPGNDAVDRGIREDFTWSDDASLCFEAGTDIGRDRLSVLPSHGDIHQARGLAYGKPACG